MPVWGLWIFMTYGVVTQFLQHKYGVFCEGEMSHALQLEDLWYCIKIQIFVSKDSSKEVGRGSITM
ncbi:hypothetical protein SLEP1_g47223 [Rubroshorea leprosula]|uniref:Uncharacterized protein n=1 Tax=Rubroshorea leprosula TaxID=152421 RepID=A0AAV5LQP6_9ROSI|nr:hypothetical protein SLEP1_g47223 [Rubroshorea leprosula]